MSRWEDASPCPKCQSDKATRVEEEAICLDCGHGWKHRCVCSMIASGGDMAPRVWICPRHGKTGMVAMKVLHQELAPHLGWEEFWDILKGAAALFRAVASDGIYYDEDYLAPDVRGLFAWAMKHKRR